MKSAHRKLHVTLWLVVAAGVVWGVFVVGPSLPDRAALDQENVDAPAALFGEAP